jgi:hypothetical protein
MYLNVIACDKREAFAQGSDSDEAIQLSLLPLYGLRRFARNDGLRPSSPGLTGRSSIPEASAIDPRSYGVLDPPHARGMTAIHGAVAV